MSDRIGIYPILFAFIVLPDFISRFST